MENKLSIADLTAHETPTWCPGCGDFSILSNIKNALVELNIPPHNIVLTSGIGCGSKLPHFVKTYGFEGLHGRALPVATGVKIANKNLTVITVIGDGDCYGIGGNHFLHTMRRNFDMTLITQDNAVYGLTKGQTSPTSQKGFKSPSTPSGVLEDAVNPMSLGIIGGATYVARGFAFEIQHLKELIVNGIKHKGFSVIDILQPCVTYNKINTLQWYKERVYKLEGSGHDPINRQQALIKAEEWGDKIPIGLFYKTEKPTYEDGLPQIAEKSLIEQKIDNVDISLMMQRFR